MRIRVKLPEDKSCTVLDIIWAEYDEEDGLVNFLSMDDDWIYVRMCVDQWNEFSVDLLINGWLDLINYDSYLEDCEEIHYSASIVKRSDN